jgi:septum formation protein
MYLYFSSQSKHTHTEYVELTARGKAHEIFLKRPDADIVIGADTMISFGDSILGKPTTKQEAYQTLAMLSGKSHNVLTGVSIFYRANAFASDPNSDQCSNSSDLALEQSFHECTEVTFADLSKEIIDAYIETGEPMDKAGAYGIQSQGGSFVKRIDGCYFNVVGFPMHRFCNVLRSALQTGVSTKTNSNNSNINKTSESKDASI